MKYLYILSIICVLILQNIELQAQNPCDIRPISTYPDGANSLNPNDNKSLNDQKTVKRNHGMFDWRNTFVPISASGALSTTPSLYSPWDFPFGRLFPTDRQHLPLKRTAHP
jgi:hypothetical protein